MVPGRFPRELAEAELDADFRGRSVSRTATTNPCLKLTKRLICDAAKADTETGEAFLRELEVKGFGLRVKPSGVRSSCSRSDWRTD